MIIGISGKAQSGKDTTARVIQALIYSKGNRSNMKELLEDNSVFMTETMEHYSGWHIKKFFDKPKQMAAMLIGCTVEDLENGGFKDRPLGEEWWYYQQLKKSPNNVFAEEPKVVHAPLTEHEKEFIGSKIGAPLHKLTPRRILQLLGDKLKEIHPMAVINSLMSDYKGEPAPNGKEGGYIEYPNWIVPDVRFVEEVEAIKKAGGIVIRVERYVSRRMPVQWEEYEKQARPTKLPVLNFFDFLKKQYPEVYKAAYHESEIALDNYKGWNGVLDNGGSLDSLRAQIEPILYKYKIPGYEYRQPK